MTSIDLGTSYRQSTDWRDHGLCTTDPAAFHAEGRTDLARRICWGTEDHRPPCPVRQTCLDYGISINGWGVFGGDLLENGRRLSDRLAAKRQTPAERTCAAPGCGKTFLPRHPHHVYHNAVCAQRVESTRRAERAAERQAS